MLNASPKHSPLNSPENRTVRGMLRDITDQLQQAGCDSPAFAAWQLVQHVTGRDRTQLLLQMENVLKEDEVKRLMQLCRRREKGEPLQYLLGEWEFMGLPFSVGKGVLIPRPETELLCETALDFLKQQSATSFQVLDLCAGSGAVGIAIASFFPQAKVTAVEKSADAFQYLKRNIARNHVQVKAVQGDILCMGNKFAPQTFDAILSNPPYIPAGELAGLQREVQHEPRMALDGGEDGLLFYRAIVSRWVPALKPGGLLAVECGIGQGAEIAWLMERYGIQAVEVKNDLSGTDRVVVGIREVSF